MRRCCVDDSGAFAVQLSPHRGPRSTNLVRSNWNVVVVALRTSSDLSAALSHPFRRIQSTMNLDPPSFSLSKEGDSVMTGGFSAHRPSMMKRGHRDHRKLIPTAEVITASTRLFTFW